METIEKRKISIKKRLSIPENLKKIRAQILEVNARKGVKVEVIDDLTNENFTYSSIRKAAMALNTNIKTLYLREKTHKKNSITTELPFLYRGRYQIKIIRNVYSSESLESSTSEVTNNVKSELNKKYVAKYKNSLGKKTIVTNLETGKSLKFDSMSLAAKYLKISITAISRLIKNNKIFNNYRVFLSEE